MGRTLIKFATRGRPDKFKQSMHNIETTIGTNDYLIVVSIDDDDQTMLPLLGVINTWKNCAAYVGKPWGKVAAINRDIRTDIEWDLLINHSDDMRWIVNGWDAIIRKNALRVWRGSTDYFYHGNDGHIFDKLPTMSIMGREYWERFGYIYHPSYKSFSCDAEAMYVAQTLGKWHYFPDQLFEHMHPVNKGTSGRHSYDATYKANDQYLQSDAEIYFGRMRKDFYIHNPTRPTVFDQHKR
jgi:hypothetical protein